MLCEGQEESLKFVLKPGGKLERDLWLENRSNETITVEKIETSCDCVNVVTPLAELAFHSLERKAVKTIVDLGVEPKYLGSFSPFLALKTTIGQAQVTLDVSTAVTK